MDSETQLLESSYKTSANFESLKEQIIENYLNTRRYYASVLSDLSKRAIPINLSNFFGETISLYLDLKPKIKRVSDPGVYDDLKLLDPYILNPNELMALKMSDLEVFSKCFDLLRQLLEELGYTVAETEQWLLVPEVIEDNVCNDTLEALA